MLMRTFARRLYDNYQRSLNSQLIPGRISFPNAIAVGP